MYITDLFEFEEKYNESDRIYSMSFEIPEASAIGSYFEIETVTNVPEDAEQALLHHFDDFFKSGRFTYLYEFPIELGDEIGEAYIEFAYNQTPTKLLGDWEFSRKGRFISITWNVPKWFHKGESTYISGWDELFDFCKSWYISFPMNESDL